MAIPSQLTGTKGEVAEVVDGGLVVSSLPAPSSESNILTVPYVGFMTPTGRLGNPDLTVDGSVNNIDVYIAAEPGFDIYIKEIKILITGPTDLDLQDFGNITGGLTNGLVPYFENANNRIAFSDRPLLSNFDVIRVGSKTPALGEDSSAFRIKGAKLGTASSSYFAIWDMNNISPSNLGVRLTAASKQFLGVEIRDNLTSLEAFEILCVGYRRFI